MQIKPNRTLLEGFVRHVRPALDGWGADVEFAVDQAGTAEGYPDFLQARPGQVVTMLAAEPEGLRAGARYAVTASVRGGPRGERVIVEAAEAKSA